jgi:hypothetical protein
MNKHAMVYLGVGLLIGGVLGFSFHNPTPDPPARSLTIEVQEPLVATNALSEETDHLEQELLLQAIEELNLTTAELDLARAQLKAQEGSLRRYDWLMEQWAKNGFGNTHSNFHWNKFRPSKGVAAFFGWDDELVGEIESVAATTTLSVKEWESANAVYVDTEEGKLVYELPAAPNTFKESYLQAMEALLPPEDYALLASKFEAQFESLSGEREISLYVGPTPAEGPFATSNQLDKEWMIVEVKSKKKSFPGYFPTSSSMIPYEEGRTIPKEWNHIFNLEVEPDTPNPATSDGMEMMMFEDLKASNFE